MMKNYLRIIILGLLVVWGTAAAEEREKSNFRMGPAIGEGTWGMVMDGFLGEDQRHGLWGDVFLIKSDPIAYTCPSGLRSTGSGLDSSVYETRLNFGYKYHISGFYVGGGMALGFFNENACDKFHKIEGAYIHWAYTAGYNYTFKNGVGIGLHYTGTPKDTVNTSCEINDNISTAAALVAIQGTGPIGCNDTTLGDATINRNVVALVVTFEI